MTRPVSEEIAPLAEFAESDLTKEHASTLLSALAMLATVTGVVWGLWPHWGPWSLCAGGVLLAALVSYADFKRRPRPEPVAPDPPTRPVLPGPADAGNLHVSGV